MFDVFIIVLGNDGPPSHRGLRSTDRLQPINQFIMISQEQTRRRQVLRRQVTSFIVSVSSVHRPCLPGSVWRLLSSVIQNNLFKLFISAFYSSDKAAVVTGAGCAAPEQQRRL